MDLAAIRQWSNEWWNDPVQPKPLCHFSPENLLVSCGKEAPAASFRNCITVRQLLVLAGRQLWRMTTRTCQSGRVGGGGQFVKEHHARLHREGVANGHPRLRLVALSPLTA